MAGGRGPESRPAPSCAARDDGSMQGSTSSAPATDRVRVRRGAIRAEYDRAAIFEVLDAGLIAHVGVVTDDGPIVLPMAYGRTDEWLYVHGSVANAALRAAVGQDVCITVTIVDGIVVGTLAVPQLDELPGGRRARHGPAGRRPRRARGRAAPRERPRHADVGDRPRHRRRRRSARRWSSPYRSPRCRRRSAPAIRSTRRPTSTVRTGAATCRSGPSGRRRSGLGDLGRRHRRPGGDRCPGGSPGVTRRNRVDPWGDLHAAGGRGLFTGNRGCLVDDDRRDRPPPPQHDAVDHVRDVVPRTGATRSTRRTCGRRCSSSTTPSPSPPATARARSAGATTTGPTATRWPRGGRPPLAAELDRRLAGERLRRGRGSPVPPTGCCGRPTSTTLPDGTVVRRRRTTTEPRSSGDVDAAVHVRRLGRAGAAARTRRGRRC